MAVKTYDDQGREIHTEGGTAGTVPFLGSDGKYTEDTSGLAYNDATNVLEAIMHVKQADEPHGFANLQVASVVSGTDTAFAATTHFITSLFLPVNKSLTGVAYLIGSVGGTDLALGALYAAGGTAVAQSATAGQTVGATATYQTLAFTATYAAKGPAMYYVGIQANGATAKVRTVPANLGFGIHGGFATVTFGGTAAAVPSTFTADLAPYVYVY